MVEKLGRRNLLLFGAIGMCVCQCENLPLSNQLILY
jgi:hypothetical protein